MLHTFLALLQCVISIVSSCPVFCNLQLRGGVPLSFFLSSLLQIVERAESGDQRICIPA